MPHNSRNRRCASSSGAPPQREITAAESAETCGGQRSGPYSRAPGELFDIKQVGEACGLPHAVIAQLVPRTWTEAGWMYTAAQLRAAVDIAERLRSTSAVEHSPPQYDPLGVLVRSRCGAVAAETDAWCWLTAVHDNTAGVLGCDYCPECVTSCAACQPVPEASRACTQCADAGRVPRP
jgi:hypothetical protein